MIDLKIAGSRSVQGHSVLRKKAFNAIWQTDTLLWIGVAVFMILEIYYLFYRFDAHRQDLYLYQRVASNVLSGKVPFRDFSLEYPLLALFPIVVSGFFSVLSGGSFASYVVWFVVQNILFGLRMAKLIGRMDRSDERQAVPRFLLVLIFSFPVYLFRFDPFPALLTVVTMSYVWRKPFVSGLSLMASIAAKLYAVVLLPVFGLYYLFNRQWAKCVYMAAGVCCMCGPLLAYYLWISPHAMSDFLNPHLLRGIQIESISGGILLLADKLGWVHVTIVESYGAQHLETTASDAVLEGIRIVTPICFLAMLGYLAWQFYKSAVKRAPLNLSVLNAAAAAQILLFILLNKVLSPQYLIWILPLIPLCRQRTYLVYTVALMLTIYIFPGHYYNLVAKQGLIICVLNIRNALLVWLLVELLGEVAASAKPGPVSGPQTPSV